MLRRNSGKTPACRPLASPDKGAKFPLSWTKTGLSGATLESLWLSFSRHVDQDTEGSAKAGVVKQGLERKGKKYVRKMRRQGLYPYTLPPTIHDAETGPLPIPGSPHSQLDG